MAETQIQVPDIENELKQLAKQGGQTKRIRACLFTLVIYARDTHRAHYMDEIVEMILEKFPCRVIFVRTDQNPETEHLLVKVSQVVSGRSAISGGVTIACDRIDIDASPQELARIPSVVVPHLVPDLPVYLLWGQIPYHDNELFPALQKYATRVIFDSECATDMGMFCRDMIKHLDDGLEVMDINWALLSNWRDLLAQLFGNEEKFSFLSNCKSLVINYNKTQKYTMAHPEIRGLYLQGWLASRLGLRFHDMVPHEENIVISYVANDNAPVIMALAPREEPTAPPGAILSMELTTIDGRSIAMVRKPNLPQVLVHVSTPEICELPIVLPLPNVNRGLTFLKEIFFSALGDHYKEMLVILNQMGLK